MRHTREVRPNELNRATLSVGVLGLRAVSGQEPLHRAFVGNLAYTGSIEQPDTSLPRYTHRPQAGLACAVTALPGQRSRTMRRKPPRSELQAACTRATLRSVETKSEAARKGYETAAKLFAMAWKRA